MKEFLWYSPTRGVKKGRDKDYARVNNDKNDKPKNSQYICSNSPAYRRLIIKRPLTNLKLSLQMWTHKWRNVTWYNYPKTDEATVQKLIEYNLKFNCNEKLQPKAWENGAND